MSTCTLLLWSSLLAILPLERAVWIWMGDEAKADPALIPDLSYLSAAPVRVRRRLQRLIDAEQ